MIADALHREQNPAYEPVSGAKECKKEDARYMMVKCMKRSEVYFSVAQVPMDYLMVVLAALSVYSLT
jgi:hypothetical protein